MDGGHVVMCSESYGYWWCPCGKRGPMTLLRNAGMALRWHSMIHDPWW